jgi:hypothetical protein
MHGLRLCLSVFDLSRLVSLALSFFEFTATLSGMMLLASTLAVTIWTVAYASVFRRANEQPVPDEKLPRTAVLMGLKGTDLLSQRRPSAADESGLSGLRSPNRR